MNGKKHFVVFGTGGSNLGARALININNNNNNISFFDNIDPIFFEKSFNNNVLATKNLVKFAFRKKCWASFGGF